MAHGFGNHLRQCAVVATSLALLIGCGSGAASEPRPAPAPVGGTPVRDRGAKSVEDMLATRFPGVTVERTNQGALRVRIRGGNNSFYNGEEPLFIVDDVPVPQGSGGLLFLDPYDIEKIEVLKNPADVALYGMRGSNGVIKVTTKMRGRR